MRISNRIGLAVLLGTVLLVSGCLHPARGLDPVPHPEPLDPTGYEREEYPADYPLGKEPRIETGRGHTAQGEAFEDHTVPCQTLCKVMSEPDDYLHWFLRAGFGAFFYEIAEQVEVCPTFSAGRRLGNDGYFLELQASIPRTRTDGYSDDGYWFRDKGRIFFYTLNLGKEFYLDDAEEWRARGHVGLGYFRTNSITSNDDGFATTLGAAIQYNFWEDVWAGLGAAHYGFVTDYTRGETSYRHNLLLDLSITWDF